MIMTNLPSPLAYFLETTREVREALAVVPRLTAELKWDEAADLVDELAIQLRETADTLWDHLTGVEPRQVALTDGAPRAHRTPLPLAGARPGEGPDIDYVDVPLGF